MVVRLREMALWSLLAAGALLPGRVGAAPAPLPGGTPGAVLATTSPPEQPGPWPAAWQAGPWWTLETPHFLIHFPEGYDALGRRVAAVAERIHPLVASRLGHEPTGKTHVVLADASDAANGMAFPFYYNQMVLFTVPPLGLDREVGLSGDATDWLELLLVHEYTHVVHLDMASGPVTGLRRLFGHVPLLATPNTFLSPALTEGYAVYQETLLSHGRGAQRLWDMFLRAATLQRRLLRLDQALGRYRLDRWNPTAGVYLYGYSWLAYAALTQGDEAVRRLTSSEAALSATGQAGRAGDGPLTLTKLDAAWRSWLTDRYQAQQADVEARGLTPFHLLSAQGWLVTSPRYSADGRRLAYLAAGGPVGSGLWLLDRENGDQRLLAEGAQGGLTWLPDGRHLVYAAPVPGPGGQTMSDLFVVDVGSGRPQRLTQGWRALAPAADGQRLAWVGLDGRQLTSHVWVAALQQADGRWELGPPRLWWKGDEGRYATGVAWHPDGHHLAVAWAGQGQTGIDWVSDGGAVQTLLRVPGQAGSPAITGDGRYLLYASDEVGVSNLYAYDLLEGRRYQLTNLLYGAFDPAPGPDRSPLVFVHYTANGYQLGELPWDPASWRPPAEPFRGAHWALPVWLPGPAGEAAVQLPTAPPPTVPEPAAGPTPGPSPSPLPLRPYSAWESLRPTWWFPATLETGGGLAPGVTTGGWDALQRHQYALTLDYHLARHQAGVEMWYQFQADPFSQLGPSVTLAFTQQREPGSWGLSRQLSAEAAYQSRFSGPYGSPFSWRLYGGLRAEQALAAAGQTRAEAYAGLAVGREAGAGPVARLGEVGIELAQPVAGESRGWRAALTGQQRVERRLDGSVGLAWATGITQPGVEVTNGFRLGGTAGTWSVRGLQLGEGQADPGAAWAVKLSLSGQRPLSRLERGLGTWPVFFGRLDTVAYVDAAVVGSTFAPSGPRKVLAAAGAGLALDLSLGYGAVELKPWLGVAHVWGGDPQQSPWRWVGGLYF